MFEDVDEGHLDGETPVHFYYNREERIKKAPKIVQDYYDGKMEPVRGFKVLFKNKSNLSILIALIFFVGFTWMYTGFNNSRNYVKTGDIVNEMQAFIYEDDVYVTIKLSSKKVIEKPALTTVKISYVNNDKQVVSEETQSVVYKEGEEYIRTKTTDYDIIRVDAMVSYEGIEKEMSYIIKH